MNRTEKQTSFQLKSISNTSITTGTALRAHGELYEAGPIDRMGRRLCSGCGEVLADPDRFNCDDCREDLYWEAAARESVSTIDRGGYASREEEQEVACAG